MLSAGYRVLPGTWIKENERLLQQLDRWSSNREAGKSGVSGEQDRIGFSLHHLIFIHTYNTQPYYVQFTNGAACWSSLWILCFVVPAYKPFAQYNTQQRIQPQSIAPTKIKFGNSSLCQTGLYQGVMNIQHISGVHCHHLGSFPRLFSKDEISEVPEAPIHSLPSHPNALKGNTQCQFPVPSYTCILI